jgi:hypothetical protein
MSGYRQSHLVVVRADTVEVNIGWYSLGLAQHSWISCVRGTNQFKQGRFIEHRYPERFRLRHLGARRIPGKYGARFSGYAATDFGSQTLQSLPGFIA